MINLWLILDIVIILAVSNYISLVYGIRLGKAMQKPIPKPPIEPIEKAVKKVKNAFRLIKNWPVKKYYQKKTQKDADDENPLFQ